MTEIKQFNVYLPVEVIREVKHLAIEEESSLSALVEAALRLFLETKRAQRKGKSERSKKP